MKSIIRKAPGKGWRDCTEKLTKKAGLNDPTDAKLRQLNRSSPGNSVSNDDEKSPKAPDARIARIKNGTIPMAYNASHAVDQDARTRSMRSMLTMAITRRRQ